MMTKPLLSILIPTVGGRHTEWNNLLEKIFKESSLKRESGYHKEINGYWMNYWHSDNPIEVISCYDEKQLTIGEKRELMYKEANGMYSWQIDDDDSFADGAIEKILEVIKSHPDIDCITFKENCIIDGVYHASNFSLKYDKWQDGVDGFAWVRTPFYKCVIRTDIAKSVSFEYIRFGEDEKWSVELKPNLRTEYHIDEEIYHYIHNSTPHHERYGFDKD